MLILDLMQVHLTFLSLFLSPLGNNLLFRSELVPIHEWRVYLPQPSHRSIPLKSGRGLAQVLDSITLVHCKVEARYVPLQVLIISFISWTWSCVHMPFAFMHMLHLIPSSFLHAWFPYIFFHSIHEFLPKIRQHNS